MEGKMKTLVYGLAGLIAVLLILVLMRPLAINLFGQAGAPYSIDTYDANGAVNGTQTITPHGGMTTAVADTVYTVIIFIVGLLGLFGLLFATFKK